MRKTILGIAVVICLDLAFIFVVMGDVKSFEFAKAIESPIVNPIMIARQLEIANLPETTIESVPEVDADRASKRVSDESAPRRPDRRSNVPAERIVASNNTPVKFEDTVIWIPRPTYIPLEVRESEPAAAVQPRPVINEAAGKSDQPKTKKKNFFKRALPVVKKPYDWLKAFAAKLN